MATEALSQNTGQKGFWFQVGNRETHLFMQDPMKPLKEKKH